MPERSLANQQKTAPSVAAPVPRGLLQRKCACGSHTVAGGECAECAKKKHGLQRQLVIGASNDPLEREAERVAEEVTAAPKHPTVNGAPPRIQRYTGQTTPGMEPAPAGVDRVLASSGRPLEPALQHDMEQRFGYDFSQVRVHSGRAAEQSARDVNANAYTVGHNVVFGAGRFAPETHEGRRLIAHELTHVMQQSESDGIRADLRKEKRGLSPFSLQQQVATGPFIVHRAPGDGSPSPGVVSLPAESENQARLAELMADWVSSPEKQQKTTISRAAAIELKTGRRVNLVAIAGEGAALAPPGSLFRPDEVLVPYTGGHAEIQTMRFAAKEGYKILPGALEPSRAFCTNCAFWARQAQLTPPDAKVRLGRRVKSLAEVSDRELAENADVKKIPGWRGELTEKGKAKRMPKAATPAPGAGSTKPPTRASAQNAQTLAGLASLAEQSIKGGLERMSAGNARYDALEDFERNDRDKIFQEMWDNPGQGVNVTFLFMLVTPKNGQPARLEYLANGHLLGTRPKSVFVGIPKEKLAKIQNLKTYPGLQVDDNITRNIWLKPFLKHVEGKTAEKPKETETTPFLINSIDEFKQNTLFLYSGDNASYELSAFELLKQSSPTFSGYLANREGHKLQIGHTLYSQLLPDFESRVRNRLARKRDRLNNKMEFYKKRLKDRREEGWLSKVINSRGDMPLNPDMFNSPEAHLVSAATTIQLGAYRHADESLKQAEVLLQHNEDWLFRYDKGYFPPWHDTLK